jgi:uncharacterized protein (TIGR02452 family)
VIASIWHWIVKTIRLWWDPSAAPILVLNKDTLDAAAEYVDGGNNILVLNLASTEEPGGGFDEGVGSQEEELCWRSDLAGLMHRIKHQEQLHNPTIWNLYEQILLTPDVTVLRANKTRSYAPLSHPFQVSILSCGAPVRPSLKERGTAAVDYERAEDKERARQLIYNQLHAARKYGYDTLVLGAFGCGAFCNPPTVIARLYREVIEAHFKDAFRKIIFAILDDPHRSGHNPQGNLRPFQRCF